MMPTYTPQRRPSWRGVLAGLLMGLVVVMAMTALALVLSSFLPFDLKGTSIGAGIYAAITALVSAFVAGYFAVKASAPEALFGDGTAIDPKDATLTGMLTAAAIIALTTYLTISGATSIMGTATKAVGSTVSTVTSAAASTVGAGASAVGSVVQNSDMNIQQEAKAMYDRVTGDISRADIEKMVAKNTQNLDQEQVSATADVLEEVLNENKAEVKELDFTDLDTWRNIDEIAKQRIASMEQTLAGPEFITRLQANGLSEPEAQQVRTEVVESFNEYKAETEQAIATAQQKADQGMQKVDQVLDTAEDTARKAALYSGLFWLISALLTFLASTMGARKAAANYRLAKPIVTWGDNVK